LKKSIDLKIDFKSLGKIFLATLLFTGITLPVVVIFDSVLIKLVSILIGGLAYLAVLAPLRYYSIDEVKVVRYLSSKSNVLKGRLSIVEKFLSKYV
jgi:hypothetical protein